MTETPITIIHPSTVEYTKAEGHKTIYVNNMRVGMTLGDVQVVLSQQNMVPTPTGKQGNIEDLATLIMSLPQTKTFLKMLTNIIAEYENNFGAINIPEQYLTPVDLRKPLPESKKAETTKSK